jgi:endoglucanase
MNTRLTRRTALTALGASIGALALKNGLASTPQVARGGLRMRGMNLETSPGGLTPSIARELAAWGVNTVRINFSTDAADRSTPDTAGPAPTRADPLAPYRQNLTMLRSFTRECAHLGIGVILAANGIFGRKSADLTDGSGASFKAAIERSLPEFWSAIAGELRNDRAIIAYDILNEPNYVFRGPEDGAVWHNQMLPNAIRRVRELNPDIWIVAMPWPWGFPSGFNIMPLIDDPHIIYSFHAYAPHTYTHQWVGTARPNIAYPGMIRDFDTEPLKLWNKAALLADVQPAIDFAQRHGVRMMASEFGVARWAPGRDRFLADLLSIFEANEIDWLFHTYGSWNGWNPSFEPDAPEASRLPSLYGGHDSASHRLLLRHWRLNTDR